MSQKIARLLIINDNKKAQQNLLNVLISDSQNQSSQSDIEKNLFYITQGQRKKLVLSYDISSQGQDGIEQILKAFEDKKPYALVIIDIKNESNVDLIHLIHDICKIDQNIQSIIYADKTHSLREITQALEGFDNFLILKKPTDDLEIRQLTVALIQKWQLQLESKNQNINIEKEIKKRIATLTLSHKKLEESAHLFRGFTEKINEVLWSITPAMDKIIYVSPAFKKVWGISIAKIYKNPHAWSDALHPEDKERVIQVLLSLDHKAFVALEFRIFRPNGSLRYIYAKGYPHKDKQGHLVNILGISTDITEYKQAQTYLRIIKEVENLLAKARDLKKASFNILCLLCNTLNWDYGEIWLMDASANKLRNLNHWSDPAVEDLAFNLKSRDITFNPGVNLPGKVFQQAKPVWIADILNHPELIRINEAVHACLNSAFGLPIIFQGKVLGTIDFFSQKITKPNKALLKMMETITNLFAEFTHQKYTEDQIIHESKHDKLTGLLNRDSFEEQLNGVIDSKEYPMIATLLLGIDQNRIILNSIGYDSADYLILAIADRLRQLEIEEEERETLARLLPDKFVLYLHNIASMEDILNQVNRMMRAFHNPFFVKGKELFISPCIAIALHPEDGETSKILLQNLDTALNFARPPYQNNIQFCTKELSHLVSQKLTMEVDLRKALSKHEFILFYQPQIDSQTGRIIGLESLIRWQHPTLGLLLPQDFIPLAEEIGLIIEIDNWVLQEVWTQVKCGWSNVSIAINISAQHFTKHFQLLSVINDLNNQYQIKPWQIEIEVTESQFLNETMDTLKILKSLIDQGISIVLDDFGTGFSSLQYLLNIPSHKIKIDKSFIDHISNDSKSISIVKSLILLAHSLGKRVLAEGVETQEQVNFLIENKCDEVQGFYFSKPIPLEEIKSMLITNKKFDLHTRPR
ncbi:MAG: EAL domain-containing protein [Tatlockia sp.]|nr:EAL domain-containing protein [Tatlockia sp.]